MAQVIERVTRGDIERSVNIDESAVEIEKYCFELASQYQCPNICECPPPHSAAHTRQIDSLLRLSAYALSSVSALAVYLAQSAQVVKAGRGDRASARADGAVSSQRTRWDETAPTGTRVKPCRLYPRAEPERRAVRPASPAGPPAQSS